MPGAKCKETQAQVLPLNLNSSESGCLLAFCTLSSLLASLVLGLAVTLLEGCVWSAFLQ